MKGAHANRLDKPFYFHSHRAEGMGERALWAAVLAMAVQDYRDPERGRFPLSHIELFYLRVFFLEGHYRSIVLAAGLELREFNRCLRRFAPWVPVAA